MRTLLVVSNSQYGKHRPILSRIAPRVLAQPGSASATERNWSIYGQIRRPTAAEWGIRLLTSCGLLQCVAATQGEAVDAAWLPKFEKWESDEESDEGEGDD